MKRFRDSEGKWAWKKEEKPKVEETKLTLKKKTKK